jgi:phosphoribosylanthranilate isomerase
VAGADAIGLIFAPARRQIALEQARAISQTVRADPDRPGHAPRVIGVFVDAAPDEIDTAVARVGLGGIQVSGSESPERCAALIEQHKLPVIKALRPSGPHDDQLAAYSAAGAVVLIEPPHANGPGGNGATGDWALARAIAARWPVILAGGLTPDNLDGAIRTVNPRGVDVSSGTETNGAKDPAKLRAFVRAARRAAEDVQVGARHDHGA